jgi:hypothetical protein
MPKQRYQRQEPTHDWDKIRPKLTDPTQMTYEIILSVILWGKHLKSVPLKQAWRCGPSTTSPTSLTRLAWPRGSHLIPHQSFPGKTNGPCRLIFDKRL